MLKSVAVVCYKFHCIEWMLFYFVVDEWSDCEKWMAAALSAVTSCVRACVSMWKIVLGLYGCPSENNLRCVTSLLLFIAQQYHKFPFQSSYFTSSLTSCSQSLLLLLLLLMANYWDSAVPTESRLVPDPWITAHISNLFCDLNRSGIVLIDGYFPQLEQSTSQSL